VIWVDWVEAGVACGLIVYTERNSFRGWSGEDYNSDDETFMSSILVY